MEELQPAIKRPDFVLGFFFEPKNGRQFMFPAPGLNATHLEGIKRDVEKGIANSEDSFLGQILVNHRIGSP